MKSFNEYFRQVFFFVILLALGSLIFLQVKFLVPGFLGAVTLYVLNRKFFFHLVFQKKWNKYIAALLLIFIDGIILLIPFGLATVFVLPKLNNFSNNANDLFQGVKEIIERIYVSTGIEIIPSEKLNDLSGLISSTFPDFVGSAVNGVVNTIFVFFLLFFMMTNAQKLEFILLKYIPLNPNNKRLITYETKNIVTSYAIGIPVLSLTQGFCAYIGYSIFGIKDPMLWGFVTCVCSVIPIVGSGLVWVPLVGYLYSHGHPDGALALAIYSIVVVINVDNILRLILLKAFADIHPLITLFGVITGLKLFGFIGLIFGPLLVSYLLLLIRIYVNEFSDAERRD
jgi:predicted PurR-regulated permease PerM